MVPISSVGLLDSSVEWHPTKGWVSTLAKVPERRRRGSYLGILLSAATAATLVVQSRAFVVQPAKSIAARPRGSRERYNLLPSLVGEGGCSCRRPGGCAGTDILSRAESSRGEGGIRDLDVDATGSIDGQEGKGVNGDKQGEKRRNPDECSNAGDDRNDPEIDKDDVSKKQVATKVDGDLDRKGGKTSERVGEKKEIHTYPARYIDDNGLIIVTDEAGRVTARRTDTDTFETDGETKTNWTESNAERLQSAATSEANTTHRATTDYKVSVDSALPSTQKTKGITPEVIAAQNPGSLLDRTPEKSISSKKEKKQLQEHPAPKLVPTQGFNVVLTHCTADFDSLASAVGLAKLWSSEYDPIQDGKHGKEESGEALSSAYQSSKDLPTFVVLPRGAHPDVLRFLALHKHLFPIKSLRSLPTDLSGLNRLGLVDAQRRDRVGPAEHLLGFADRVTVVDHHIDAESDIPEATDYVVDKVGSVSTMIVERLRNSEVEVSEAEATLLALGIHADTGSLCFDSSTSRDAEALAWVMAQGASQAAIAEHAKGSLSPEQQGVLTQTLINTNSTDIHGVTVSTVLLSADGFINGLAAVTQDALELSSSDVFLLCVVYDAKSGRRKNKGKGELLESRLLEKRPEVEPPKFIYNTEAWKGGEDALRQRRLRAAFDKKDVDGSGYLERGEIAAALSSSGVVATTEAVDKLMAVMDVNNDGRVDFDEFCEFATTFEERQKEQEAKTGRRASTMIIIGRVKAGVNTKSVNLNRLFQQFGGGGHPKAASATVRLGDESEADSILQGLVDELIETGLAKQPTVGDFMTAPVLSAKPTMTETQVEDLFSRYDVRALPVVDDDNNVIGLVTYKEVAAAKQRLWNKEQKRLRQEAREAAEASSAVGSNRTSDKSRVRRNKGAKVARDRKLGSALKGWMKQHVRVIEASTTMAEAEMVLLENDVGCIPVVADGSKQLVGMVTRTDLLRQHQYYPTLHYHNKGFSDSIAARKPIIELRRRLKKFDLDE